MKKILTFLMIFVALFTFVACDTGNSSSGNGDNGDTVTSNVEIINPDDVAEEFADCTTDVDFENVVISDGNWTVIHFDAFLGETDIGIFQATAKNSKLTYTSGTGRIIGDCEIRYIDKPEKLAELKKASSDEEKTAIVFGELTEGETVTWDGLTFTLTAHCNSEDLEWYTENNQPYDLFNDEGGVIKTNADKTKYTITISYTDEDIGFEETYIYCLEKN